MTLKLERCFNHSKWWHYRLAEGRFLIKCQNKLARNLITLSKRPTAYTTYFVRIFLLPVTCRTLSWSLSCTLETPCVNVCVWVCVCVWCVCVCVCVRPRAYKFATVHTIKVCRGIEGIVPSIFVFDILCKWVVTFTPQPLYSQRRFPWCVHWIAGWMNPRAGLMLWKRKTYLVAGNKWTTIRQPTNPQPSR